MPIVFTKYLGTTTHIFQQCLGQCASVLYKYTLENGEAPFAYRLMFIVAMDILGYISRHICSFAGVTVINFE
jgi:hypothetical protein